MQIQPVATIHNDFTEKFGIPRQSGRAPDLLSEIVFEEEYRIPEALRGIGDFSHLWLIFDFSEAHREKWTPTVRPPRLGGNKRVGVFASRSPFRPNNLGLSCVKLVSVNPDRGSGITLTVSGADLLDGTPIYDIKPYLPYADSHPEAVGGFADQFKEHRLLVSDPENILSLLPEDKIAALKECIADDPRPSYQDDRERIYCMRYGNFEIRFRVEEGAAIITAAETAQ